MIYLGRIYLCGTWNRCIIFAGFWIYCPVATELSAALAACGGGG